MIKLEERSASYKLTIDVMGRSTSGRHLEREPSSSELFVGVDVLRNLSNFFPSVGIRKMGSSSISETCRALTWGASFAGKKKENETI